MLLHFPLHSLLLSSVRFAKLCRKFGLVSGRAKFYFGDSQQKTLMARVPCPSITKGGLRLLSLCLVTHVTLCSSITTHSLCALFLGLKGQHVFSCVSYRLPTSVQAMTFFRRAHQDHPARLQAAAGVLSRVRHLVFVVLSPASRYPK